MAKWKLALLMSSEIYWIPISYFWWKNLLVNSKLVTTHENPLFFFLVYIMYQ